MPTKVRFKHTEETKQKLRLIKLGCKFSDEHKAKLSAAKIGKATWNKGKKLTIEHRKHLSESHMGKIPPHKGKKLPERSGPNCHLWRGGITPINQIIRHSLEYKLWRKAVFERDNYTCGACKAHGVKFHAHHVKPFSLFPELRFAIDNGSTLCIPCHKLTDTYGNKAKKYA